MMRRLTLGMVLASPLTLSGHVFGKPIRISSVALPATPGATAPTEFFEMTILDGAGAVASKYQTVAGTAVATIFLFSVNNPNAFPPAINAVPSTVATAALPPDLVINPQDSVLFDFAVDPASIDGPLIISYEELES